jgi:hypothetical protein
MFNMTDVSSKLKISQPVKKLASRQFPLGVRGSVHPLPLDIGTGDGQSDDRRMETSDGLVGGRRALCSDGPRDLCCSGMTSVPISLNPLLMYNGKYIYLVL